MHTQKWKTYLSELAKAEDIDLSSFKIQDDLHPKFWDEQKKLNPRIRKRLLKRS